MAKQDFSNATKAELIKHLHEAQNELGKLLFQVHTNQLKDVRSIRHKRQEIARLHTALTQTIV